MAKAIRCCGYALLAIATPGFLENAFEVYPLTFFQGPQMVGFSLIHSAQSWVIIGFFISFAAFYLLTVYAIVVIVMHRFGKLSIGARHARVFSWVLIIQLIHYALGSTYSWWAEAFFSRAS